ncbi:4-hydroxyphenylpyruvate dioxygenase [Candidatus Paraburkholderia kirkii UZHbot1]|uniref:3-dehydroshikimate dehydratase n=1 Tax=Candidatus Paraburkholderia kirkii UZHbot1 TaxID=1055526 RepID=G4MG09_9BURK|nr:4-hydroxyphenylpyruvate dioxygenase [Candidatus Paraburkholderia kirkii UZHbot1]
MLRSIRTSIATVSISGTLPEKLQALKAAGFDGVEIFENDFLYFDGTPGDVRRMCEDLGLAIYLFQPFRDFEGVSAERLARNVERAKRKFELMHELGTDRMLACSNVSPDMIRDDALIVDQLGVLARTAEEAGVIVAYEALAWGRHVFSYKHAWKLVDAVNHPNLGLALDTFQRPTLSIRDSVDEIASIPGERIAFVQIADAPMLAMDVLEWSRHYRCFPGQGAFDVAGFTARVLEAGYKGPLSLEIFNDGFRAAPTAITAADGYRSLRFLEEQTRALIGENAPPELFNPPAPPEHIGFQFLEFAVDDTAREHVAQWLGRLGFRLAGKHRSKDVQLYRHGAGSIVLNAEADSFASAFFQQHGLSLCASAFHVDDAKLAFERAAAYGSKPFSGRVGPNERVVPGVQSPDGSLDYFVDEAPGDPTLWESDFVLTDIDGPYEVGPLSRIDHVCLSLPADALDTWVLFFRSAFGFETEAAVLVPDPYGLVHSRAVRSRDGSVRIALNASMDRYTAVSESLSTYRGSGLNHVAFSTPDNFDAIPRLEADGVRFLRIPRNYYDDLVTRFGLPDEQIDKMREHNILYDRDERGGEFFHAYMEQLDQRFFLKVIERRGGYDGYGAANSGAARGARATAAAGGSGGMRARGA